MLNDRIFHLYERLKLRYHLFAPHAPDVLYIHRLYLERFFLRSLLLCQHSLLVDDLSKPLDVCIDTYDFTLFLFDNYVRSLELREEFLSKCAIFVDLFI